jgi:hypothetical protein
MEQELDKEQKVFLDRCERLMVCLGIANKSESSGRVWCSCILHILTEIFLDQPDPQAAYEEFLDIFGRFFEIQKNDRKIVKNPTQEEKKSEK